LTIAACYVSPEGIVLGADSTSTVAIPGGNPHYLNYAQKLFAIGEEGAATLGALTWGVGGLDEVSHRTLIALLADDLRANAPTGVRDVAIRWTTRFWTAYEASPSLRPFIDQCRALNAKKPFDPVAIPPDPSARTQQEETDLSNLRNNLFVGFCIGGYVMPDRTPVAFEILCDPIGPAPIPAAIPVHYLKFWGAPNMFLRLIQGCDGEFRGAVLRSGNWAGTAADLDALILQQTLSHPVLPIRDAVDYTHACIASTIKAIKFSQLSQICGGPIELAVITSDRPFRWVRHKGWDIAIMEGDP